MHASEMPAERKLPYDFTLEHIEYMSLQARCMWNGTLPCMYAMTADCLPAVTTDTANHACTGICSIQHSSHVQAQRLSLSSMLCWPDLPFNRCVTQRQNQLPWQITKSKWLPSAECLQRSTHSEYASSQLMAPTLTLQSAMAVDFAFQSVQ